MRCSDHGEMGLSHGGLRQKAFNAYEETINVPIVVSNPVLFGEPAETGALASLVDLLPTIATLAGADVDGAGLRGSDLSPVLARHAEPGREALGAAPVDLSAITAHPSPPNRSRRRSTSPSTTTRRERRPSRRRASRTGSAPCARRAGKYAIYSTRAVSGRASTSSTTSSATPTRRETWSASSTARPLARPIEPRANELRERLRGETERCGTEVRAG